MASNPTEKTLNALLSTVQRIESMLTEKKKDKKAGGDIKEVVSGINDGFVNMSKSLEKIEGESKKTNELLEELINVSSYNAKEVAKETKETVKGLNKLGTNVNRLIKAIQFIGKVPDAAIDKFRSVLMLSAFLDPKTGKPLADDKQLEKASQTSKALLNIVKGIALFGLTLVAFSFMLPQIFAGIGSFVIVLGTVALALWTVDKVVGDKPKDQGPVKSLLVLGASIALFGTTMVLLSFVLPQIAKGTIGFIIVLTNITLALFMMDLVLGIGAGGLKDTSPLGTLHKLGVAISIFAVVFVLMSLVLPQIALGALGFLTIVGALTLGIWMMHKVLGKSSFKLGNPAKKKKGGGKGPLGTLSKLLYSIVVFSLGMILVGLAVKPFATGALAILLSLTALAVVMIPYGLKFMKQGAKNLQRVSYALIAFTGALAIYAQLAAPKLTWESIGMLGAVIGVMGLVGTVLGIPPISNWVKSGASALVMLGLGLSAFTVGLSIYAQLAAPKLTWENIGMLGAVIGVMALVGTLIGIPPIIGFVLAGAVGLIMLGGALITFTTGLAIFAASKFNEKDAKNLNAALRYTIAGFLGYESLDDVGIGALAWVPMMVGLLIPAAAAMTFASLALLPISMALAIFKKTKWSDKDSRSLNAALYGVASGFTEGLEDISWASLWWGVNSMKNVGKALTGLAEGIQAFANLTFTEYEFNEEKGEMVPVRKIRLTPADIAKTGVAIGMVISAVTKPLATFGEQMTGGSGAGFLGVDWGKMIAINFGIKSLQGIGNGLVNLAAGVQDWANMTITEYDIMTNKETGLPEIVPVKKRPIKNAEIKAAMVNISDVLSAIAKPLSDFGQFFVSEQQGWFGSTYQVENKGLKYGIEGLANIGSGLVNMADGVVKWANMEYTEYGVMKNPETGMNELVPMRTAKIKKPQLDSAMYNIGYVLSTLVKPLSSFGEMFTTTEKGWFGSTYQVANEGLITGIEQMGAVANGLSTMADMMARWANMEYTEMEVYKDPKTGQSKLQPKKVKKLGVGRLMLARFNIGLTISTISQAFMDYLRQTEGNGGPSGVNSLVEELVIQQKGLEKIAKYIEPWSDGKFSQSVMNFWSWVCIGRPLHTIGKATMEYVKITRGDKLWNADWGFEKIVEEWGQVLRGLGDVAIYTDLIWNKPSRLMGASNFKMWMYTMSYPFMLEFMGTLARFGPAAKNFDTNFKGFVQKPKMVAMTVFTNNILRLAKSATSFEKFANSFEKMAVSMGTFSNNFNLMNPDGIQAFTTWTTALLQAVEAGKQPGLLEVFSQKAGAVVESAFKFGEQLFGSDDEEGKLGDDKKKSIIEKTNKAAKDQQIEKLVAAVSSLQEEISGLKSALGGEMNVNVTNPWLVTKKSDGD